MESSPKREVAGDEELTRLLQSLDAAQYTALVERVAEALWRRAMIERAGYSKPSQARRMLGAGWGELERGTRDDWHALAHRALQGEAT